MRFPKFPIDFQRTIRSRQAQLVGAVLLLVVVSGVLFSLIVTGKTRRAQTATVAPVVSVTATTTMAARRLDGVFVAVGEEAFRPRAVIVENLTDARPLSGPAKASIAIEAPVEGGITRFLLLFDATTTLAQVGPVRSARPYFVDWVNGWNAIFFHVGGSQEALQRIASLRPAFADVDEMVLGQYFWRSNGRAAPHHIFTKTELMNEVIAKRGHASSTAVTAWHFQDAVTSTERGDATSVNIPYGGNYNVRWRYDRERGVYVRWQAGREQKDADGSPVEAENVIVIKTDARTLDEVGRLQIRTTGGGDATGYRDGKKFILRWSRAAGEPMRFQGNDGAEFIFTRGRTWIQVTTDDLTFSGLSR